MPKIHNKQHKEKAERDVLEAVRDQVVAKFIIEGLTVQRIAAELNLSVDSIRNSAKRVVIGWQKEMAAQYNGYAVIMLQRFESLYAAVAEAALGENTVDGKPDMDAHKRAESILLDEMKLLGLNAPERIQLNISGAVQHQHQLQPNIQPQKVDYRSRLQLLAPLDDEGNVIEAEVVLPVEVEEDVQSST